MSTPARVPAPTVLWATIGPMDAWIRVVPGASALVLDSPHSGTAYPDDFGHACEMGELALTHLIELNPRELMVANRTAERATRLAERLREIDDWLAQFRRLWSSHLDKLERHLDRVDKTPSPKKEKGRTK